jgi:dolichyl-phosphate-mannose-protein mannosyltransferase
VTLYPYRDPNNLWKVLKAEDTVEYKPDMIGKNQTHLEYVRNWDTVRLEHVVTSPRKLHSHDIDAPITDTGYHKEVR